MDLDLGPEIARFRAELRDWIGQRAPEPLVGLADWNQAGTTGGYRNERMAQAKTLLGQNWLGHPDCRDPVILLGDFNVRRQSVAYRMFTGRLRDAQLVLHKRARRTFPARMPMLRIDHIFCSRSVDVLGVEVPRSRLVRTASDHLPLVMDFRVIEHERARVSVATETLVSVGPSGQKSAKS